MRKDYPFHIPRREIDGANIPWQPPECRIESAAPKPRWLHYKQPDREGTQALQGLGVAGTAPHTHLLGLESTATHQIVQAPSNPKLSIC